MFFSFPGDFFYINIILQEKQREIHVIDGIQWEILMYIVF